MRFLAILALLCSPAWAAIPVFVQASNGYSGPSVSSIATTATATTAGNVIFVIVRHVVSSCAAVTLTVADTAGNTYYEVASMDSADFICLRGFFAFNITAHATNVVTATAGVASVGFGVITQEFSGVDKVTPRDTFSANFTGGGTSVTTPELSTFFADEVIAFGVEVNATGGTWTAPSGYTIPTGATPTGAVLTAGYQIYSSVQSGITISPSSTSNNSMIILAFGMVGRLRNSLPGNAASAQ